MQSMPIVSYLFIISAIKILLPTPSVLIAIALSPNFTIDPHRRYNEIIHLTYFVKSEISDNAAKFIISIPKDILTPQNIEQTEPRFEDSFFSSSLVDVDLILGKTTFPVADIKKLDIGDIVVFENSKSSEMTLVCENIIQKFEVKPNINIVEPYENGAGGDDNMSDTNLWDSIQVEMQAEFDKVKITLGDLKSIEEGLIVDLCSVYDNKVSLKVGGKIVAEGDLVIINDRFGVKIDKVNDGQNAPSAEREENQTEPEEHEGDEDFDYSDFDVDENNETEEQTEG